jgi:pimeloyl-ACP methyl ester carboxylesterase
MSLPTIHRLALPLVLVLLSGGCAANQARAQGRLFRPGAPTLGGAWLWSDEVIDHEWRIQKHALVGHYRLIDPHDRRQTFGEFETCLAKLDQVKAAQKLPPLPKDVVIVLHGLGAGRKIMNGLCDYLTEQGGYYVINVGYPSTILTVADYAQSLDSIIRHLDGVENVSFVAHSMGNIVIRKYLRDLDALTPAMRPPVKFQRMVMITPPNHGAEIADRLQERDVTRELSELFAGEPAKQLAPGMGWPDLERQLATPSFEFGIIAGGRGDDSGYLSAIPGDDDFLLSVETTKLAGAADFIQIPGIHQTMPMSDSVRAATLNFLKHGYFESAETRQPIVAAAASSDASAAAAP